MPSVFSNLLYIGNFADMDTNESNMTNENPNLVAGTYGNGDMELLNVEFEDNNSDGVLMDNEAGGPIEVARYTVGSNTYASNLDSTSVFNATITEGDGSSFNTLVTVIQLTNGDVFIAEYANNGTLDGKNIQSITLNTNPDTNYGGFFNDSSMTGVSVVCFTRDALILTVDGPKPLTRLRLGERIVTKDNGPQPLRWMEGQFHAYLGAHAPICIAAGSLGLGSPTRDLTVSPQHRILAHNKVAERMFGVSEVLVSAKSLLGCPGVSQLPQDTALTYWHLAFDAHEVISANGAWVEALYPGPMAQSALSDDAQSELRSLVPGVWQTGGKPPLARPCPPLRQQLRLVGRLQKNGHALLNQA